MSPRLPDGEPAPADGALPGDALGGLGTRPFGLYVHVPFCATRCGYCDFNTYVPGEGVRREGFVDDVLAEWALARHVLGGDPPAADTVFVGGGTPTLLPVGELARLLDALPRAAGAEVTVEANPDSVDLAYLRALRAAGATRLSLGMQSAAGHVLAVLDRTTRRGRPSRRRMPRARRASRTSPSTSSTARPVSATRTGTRRWRPSARRASTT